MGLTNFETKIIREGLRLRLVLKGSTMPIKKSESNPTCSMFHLTRFILTFYMTHFGDIQLLAAVTLTLIFVTHWLYITLGYKCLHIYESQMISKIVII